MKSPVKEKARRLDQLLSSLGYGSRREVQGMISRGRVTVGEEVEVDWERKVQPSLVKVQGQALEGVDGLFVLFHKPLGYSCTHSTQEGASIYELLPARWLQRNPKITSIGRLDKDTSGVLLLTDRGDLVQKMTSPKSECDKIYEATFDQDLDPALIEVFASGELQLNGEKKPYLPAKLEILEPRKAQLTIHEGKYHQVRRMFASQGFPVQTLHRLKFGEFELDGLKPGEWRLLELAD